MEEPELDSLHPFSSHFRTQLSDVLSRPARHIKPDDDKQYLETEIDAYSGVEFGNSRMNSPKRPPTPPKPVHRTFTFDKTNPFSNNTSDVNRLSLPRYAEVNKPKNRPKIPPKPKIRTNTRTLPHSQKQDEHTSQEDSFSRANSLPNLAPEIKPISGNIRASGHFLSVDNKNSTPGYGKLTKKRPSIESNVSEYHMAQQDTDYCDVIPESPVNKIKDNETPRSDGRYENIYEDVNSKEPASEKVHPKVSPGNGSNSDYTLMSSPMSDIHFTFGRKSLYENSPMIPSPNPDVFTASDYENIGTPFPLGDPNVVGLPGQVAGSRSLALSKDHVSPASSFDDHDSSAYSIQSSMASTTASSFQRVQVCYFPPSPPPEFYHDDNSEGSADVAVLRAGSVTSGSSTRSRSRSRIPIPIKPKNKDQIKIQNPTHSDVHDQLPTSPSSSPASQTKSTSMNIPKKEPPYAKPLMTRSAKWYEKFGCIQTDTIHPSEPYGRSGERKRSKSLNRDKRKSQFFLPVEPNASDPPNVPIPH